MSPMIGLLVFRLDDRLYALNLAQVDRVIRAMDAAPLPRAPQIVLGAINIGGQIVPLLDTRKGFGILPREIGLDDHFILAATSRRTVALAVDSVRDVIERPADAVVASEKIVPGLDQIDGVIQLEDGLTLIHDLDRFLSLDEELALDEALRMEPVYG